MVDAIETEPATTPDAPAKPKRKRPARKKTATQPKEATPSADVTLSRCPGCDSTDRTHYSSTIERAIELDPESAYYKEQLERFKSGL